MIVIIFIWGIFNNIISTSHVIVYVHVCLHAHCMRVHVRRCTHECSCMLTPEIVGKIFSLITAASYVFGQSFSLNLNLTFWLEWLASRQQASVFFVLQQQVREELTAKPQFYLVASTLNSGFWHVRQASQQVTSPALHM